MFAKWTPFPSAARNLRTRSCGWTMFNNARASLVASARKLASIWDNRFGWVEKVETACFIQHCSCPRAIVQLESLPRTGPIGYGRVLCKIGNLGSEQGSQNSDGFCLSSSLFLSRFQKMAKTILSDARKYREKHESDSSRWTRRNLANSMSMGYAVEFGWSLHFSCCSQDALPTIDLQ